MNIPLLLKIYWKLLNNAEVIEIDSKKYNVDNFARKLASFLRFLSLFNIGLTFQYFKNQIRNNLIFIYIPICVCILTYLIGGVIFILNNKKWIYSIDIEE